MDCFNRMRSHLSKIPYTRDRLPNDVEEILKFMCAEIDRIDAILQKVKYDRSDIA